MSTRKERYREASTRMERNAAIRQGVPTSALRFTLRDSAGKRSLESRSWVDAAVSKPPARITLLGGTLRAAERMDR